MLWKSISKGCSISNVQSEHSSMCGRVPLRCRRKVLHSNGSRVNGRGIVLWFQTVLSTRLQLTDPWKQKFFALTSRFKALTRLALARTYTLVLILACCMFQWASMFVLYSKKWIVVNYVVFYIIVENQGSDNVRVIWRMISVCICWFNRYIVWEYACTKPVLVGHRPHFLLGLGGTGTRWDIIGGTSFFT